MIPIDEVLSRMEGLERRLGGGFVSPGGGADGEAPRSGNRGGATGGAAPEANRRTQANPAAFDARATKNGAGGAGAGGEAAPPSNAHPKPPDSAAPAGRLSEARAEYRTGGAAAAEKRWNEFKTFVTRQDAALCAKIESARCLACGEGRLRIGFTKGYLFRDDVDARKAAIESLAREFFGRETLLEIETLAPEAAGTTPNGNGLNSRTAKNHRLREIRRQALSHPLVLKVLDVFPGAEVRDVRLREISAADTAAAPPSFPPDGDGLPPSEAAPGPTDDGMDQE
jgi:hypothetical protein